MADHEKHDHDHDHDHEPGRSTAATFGSRAEAREAIAALHKAHFTHTWLGVTSLAETDRGDETVTVESQHGGFFSASESLVDALVSHGVLGDVARDIETTIEPGCALVTVDPKDKDLGEAVALLERHGGRVAGGVLQPAGKIPSASRAPLSAQVDSPAGDAWEEETFYRGAASPR